MKREGGRGDKYRERETKRKRETERVRERERETMGATITHQTL